MLLKLKLEPGLWLFVEYLEVAITYLPPKAFLMAFSLEKLWVL